jgi:hypothetical protein
MSHGISPSGHLDAGRDLANILTIFHTHLLVFGPSLYLNPFLIIPTKVSQTFFTVRLIEDLRSKTRSRD